MVKTDGPKSKEKVRSKGSLTQEAFKNEFVTKRFRKFMVAVNDELKPKKNAFKSVLFQGALVQRIVCDVIFLRIVSQIHAQRRRGLN